jgi:anti-anti-sigma factor
MRKSCTVNVSRSDSGYLVTLVGRGTMRESPAVRDFASGVMEDGSRIVLDLSNCEYLDSTFLGCLVLLHKRGAGNVRRFSVFAPEETRQRLLASVRLHQILEFVKDRPACLGDPVELPVAELERIEFCQHLMETHRKLAELGGPAADAFRRIADQLAREFEEGFH